MLFLPIDFLSGWLFRINSDKVRPELIGKLIQYRKECFTLLRQEFQADMLLANTGIPFSSVATLEKIRQTGLMIAQEAERQIQKEQQLNIIEGSLYIP